MRTRSTLLGCLCAATAAVAAPIPMTNPGFEADFAAGGTFPVGPVTGWPAYDPLNLLPQPGNFTGVINPTGTSFFNFADAPEGRNAALLFCEGTIGQGPIGLSQTLDAVLEAYTTYTLTVEVGNIASGIGLPPFGTLDLSDVNAFAQAFRDGEPPADLGGDGLIDLTDINLFVAAFTDGCP